MKRRFREWNEHIFTEDMRAKVQDKAIHDMILDLCKFARENADLIEFGSGTESGSFTFKILSKDGGKKISVFTIWSNGTLNLRFANMAKRASKKIAESFYDGLQTLPTSNNWNREQIMQRSLAVKTPFKEVLPDKNHVELFKSAVLKLKRALKE